MRGRPDDHERNDSPGPGHYSPSHSAVKDKVAAYKMDSKSKRADLVSKEAKN